MLDVASSNVSLDESPVWLSYSSRTIQQGDPDLGAAHGYPARAHELPLDEERLDEGRASAEDGLEGLASGLADVLWSPRNKRGKD